MPGTVAAAHHVGMADAMVCHSDFVATGATDTLLHATWFSMVGGHVLATVVTAWMLARGEALLWQLADQIVRASLPPAALWPAAALRVLAEVFSPASHGKRLQEQRGLLQVVEQSPQGGAGAAAGLSDRSHRSGELGGVLWVDMPFDGHEHRARLRLRTRLGRLGQMLDGADVHR